MYLPFWSDFPSCLEIFALFSALIFTRFAETLSFVLEFWVSSLSFEFFHPWVFLARSKKSLLYDQRSLKWPLLTYETLKAKCQFAHIIDKNQDKPYVYSQLKNAVNWTIEIKRFWPQKFSEPHDFSYDLNLELSGGLKVRGSEINFIK